jgi:glucosamine--fructose-6-phosphate aminotransferase (isomerizing)
MTSSILREEIYSQPVILSALFEEERQPVTQLAHELEGSFEYVLIAARGSSDNAARYAQYLLGAENRIQVALATPSLFTIYQEPPRLEGALIIGISQSGQSPDIVEVIAEGRRQGRPTLAITNDTGSPMAETAKFCIPLHAGPELAIAASKTYTASLGALALLSCALSGNEAHLEQLLGLPAVLESSLAQSEQFLSRVERYRYMQHCAVIGRGYNYATAFEVALKIKELTRIVAEPYSSADFRHGPIAMAWDGFPVILVAPQGAVQEDFRSLMEDLHSRKAEILVISDDDFLLERANLPMRIPSGQPEWLTPMVAVLPGQLFSMALAEVKGLDPDRPEGLRKVTETV